MIRTALALLAVLALAPATAAQESSTGWLNDALLSRAWAAPVTLRPGGPLAPRHARMSPAGFRLLERDETPSSGPTSSGRTPEQHKLIAAVASSVLAAFAGFPPAGLAPQDRARLNLQYGAVNGYFTEALLRSLFPRR